MKITAATLPIAFALRYARYLIPLRGWDRVFRAVFPPDRQKSFDFSLPIFGRRITMNASQYLDWSALFYGCYERPDLLLIRRFLKSIPHAVAVDVGANTGHFTIPMSDVCEQVYAFEAYPPIFLSLQARLRTAAIRNVTATNVGLSDQNGQLLFAPPDEHNTGVGSFRSDGTIACAVAMGDTILGKLPQLDLIKIDVEGHEPAVLAGLRQTISACRPVVVVELNYPASHIAALLPEGYSMWAHRGPHGIFDFTSLEAADAGLNIGNAVCVPKERIGPWLKLHSIVRR